MPTHSNNPGLPAVDMPFRLVRSETYETLSQALTAHIVDCLRRKPDALLVLATGASPERAYQLLAEQGRQEPGLCARMKVMKLDEWGGLSMDDPATCETYLRRLLIEPLGIGPDRFFGWTSRPGDVAVECLRVRKLLEQHGPADICVLGLGLNGHLGFNEPGDHVQPGPHRAELSKESKEHSMVQIARSRPEYGLTLGLRDILQAREILLPVSGAAKRNPLRRLLKPEISSSFPASFLWLHPALTVFCDTAAL